MHFVSKRALDVINNNLDTRLIKEHALPVSVIYELLYKENLKKERDVEDFLINYYRLGVLTFDEDKKLTEAKLKYKMPLEWNKNMNVLYRYEVVEIN